MLLLLRLRVVAGALVPPLFGLHVGGAPIGRRVFLSCFGDYPLWSVYRDMNNRTIKRDRGDAAPL